MAAIGGGGCFLPLLLRPGKGAGTSRAEVDAGMTMAEEEEAAAI
jgi:hypothetical protein